MKSGMSIQELLAEVVRQNDTKKDFVASTKESMRMVESEGSLWIVLLKDGAEELERFSISENAHRQIAGRLTIPWKYYQRLLHDHRDMVIDQVNKLFEREPEMRLLRTLDGVARAFLSNKYRRLDNDQVLEQVLPPIVQGDIETTLLSSNVGDNAMHLKVLFTDPTLTQTIGTTAGRRPDTVQPGILIKNSETGNGSLSTKGFFFRHYCLNGCVFGTEEAFSFSRNHVGGRLVQGQNFEVFSDSTKRKQDELIIAEIADSMNTMIDPARVQAMGDHLRAIKEGEQCQDRAASVDAVVKELDLREGESQGILESFIKDQDFSQWGMVNAVTAQANRDDVSYERACELEEIGSKIIQLNTASWSRIANAELVAA